jgi:hypothetical protein
MAYWVSTESYSSRTVTSELQFPGDRNKTVLNKSVLPDLIYLAGFSKLKIIQNEEPILDSPENRYRCTVLEPTYHTSNFNQQWPVLNIDVNPTAMKKKWELNNGYRFNYSNQLNSILKNALVREGVKQNSSDMGLSFFDVVMLRIWYQIYATEIGKISDPSFPAWIPSIAITYIFQLAISNATRGFSKGDKSPGFGAKESLFFGIKFDRIFWLGLQTSISRLAAPADGKTVMR